ncbi:tRNA 2-thiocytidine biosynthesis TtcA family protein [Clostridium botulinum]|uniref:tRNA 2-thiocytidine(32) synthetase TtcA n=1 Tax=Clostridium botulinum TaxID=1491 RepID=A0A6G4EDM3_CLOBO|nr:ATP-binding protein [Clostridium botulinum]APH19049.1 tRNA methyl transferase family protein [Clostridium botulinum]AUM89916.1 tRNA 2-thiocytidine(32) synthetase TtcA [Clostridium botulinum]NFB14326.1 tRNA 2-thiocytidine(32) synthetase TtcA [Clostridium botulinum]NFH59304.1 tRNA 2-thiocytidine(32) synthetase TtcA [Clostridium botulinum]NFH61337.1 tRNA 2-thiocytidine(32) synthetase TtcA [Clostridium botulinum]
MQKLLGKLRRAVGDFNLIQNGDKIAVGLSGGKDSIVLLHLLKKYQSFSPEKFDLIAITLDTMTGGDFSPLENVCSNINVPLYIYKTPIKEIVFDLRKEKNPCSLCANLRRGALNNYSKELGCNKIALGHHKNDAIETLLMSMLYEGRVSCFSPKTYLNKTNITIIRPMIYIDEIAIKSMIKRYDLPIIKNPCPANGNTKRQYMKELTYTLEKDIPKVKDRLLGCLTNINQINLWDKDKIQ